MSVSALLASYGLPTLIADAADFDGTNDYMLRGADLTGIADGKSGAISFWYRVDGGDGTTRQIFNNNISAGQRFHLHHLINNKFEIVGSAADGSGEILKLDSVNAYLATSTWLHILASWDLASNVSSLYINDVSDHSSIIRTNNTIDYSGGTNWAVGSSAYSPGSDKINGCLAEVYFAPNQYLDFSVESNRRKFITAAGKPAHLGTDGSLPTGTAPIMYHHLDNGEAVANFATNRGTGGNFTITGTLDTASTSPTD
jgi:hypothetical protein